jgi:ferredoxin/flavodoxin---NADP+ reductase
MRIAIVGAGPSGFYAAGQLLAAGFEVDLLDALPTPFGLVRAGVAPDHPKIKTVTKAFDKIAEKEGFRFFGGVVLGRDITPADLVERYHGVLYAIGTATDRRLGIPGEELPGSVAATDFVAWYNGHPDHHANEYDLDVERVVVVGNGNVAIDVARMLVLSPDELAVTDTADHAIAALNASAVREVVILGRRGPAQAAFTNPELLELGELSRADVVVDPTDLEGVTVPDDAHATTRKNVAILQDYAQRELTGKPQRVSLRFFWSPVEILGDDRVEAVRVVRNAIVDGRAVPTDRVEEIPCGLVVRSIGYRGEPVDGLPFDEGRGLIANEGGRVTGKPREYVTGWIKRGPSGVIGTNKKDSQDTTAKVVEDAEAGRLDNPHALDADAAEQWLRTHVPDVVEWDGWRRIDAHETAAGEPHGRPRVKIVRHEHFSEALGRDRARLSSPSA